MSRYKDPQIQKRSDMYLNLKKHLKILILKQLFYSQEE